MFIISMLIISGIIILPFSIWFFWKNNFIFKFRVQINNIVYEYITKINKEFFEKERELHDYDPDTYTQEGFYLRYATFLQENDYKEIFYKIVGTAPIKDIFTPVNELIKDETLYKKIVNYLHS